MVNGYSFSMDIPTYRVKTFIPFIVPAAATEALDTCHAATEFQLKGRLGNG